jgi:hypothetical protein
MIYSNILLVDNCRVDIENTKMHFLCLVVETNLYFAENDLEAWSQLQGNNKVAQRLKFF